MPLEPVVWEVDRRKMLRAEIDGAISLFFEGNNIASRLLVWAAIDVLRDLLKIAGLESFHGRLEDHVRGEYVSDWRRILRNHYTYFKHAKEDPHRVICDYRPEATGYNILGAVADYITLYRTKTVFMATFMAWMFGRYPNLIRDDAPLSIEERARFAQNADATDFDTSLIWSRDRLREFTLDKSRAVALLAPEIRGSFEDL
jgi:hypothetical protein